MEENLRMGLAYKNGSTPIPTELFELFPVLTQMIHRRGGDLSGGQPMAIVLVEQYYDFAEELADQYLVMERGEVMMRGRSKDMQADGVHQRMAI